MPATSVAPGPLMAVSEVADLLQVTPATVMRWIDRGDLNAFAVGSTWCVYQPDLADFLDDMQVSSQRREG